ncbi:MAG: DUF3526 domain-containing protein [Flavobacteriaceae bacterium]
MIKKIFFKELKEMIRDGRIRLLFFIVICLTGLSLLIKINHYKEINRQYESATISEREVWDNQGEKNPHSASHFGTYAFKPKYPLSLIDQGVDKYIGTSIFLESHKRNEAQFSAASDQTGLSRFGDLSPDFILLFIVPLLTIFLGFNSFTKEIEMGTFVLLKSQGVNKWKWMIGKWFALFVPILALTVILFFIAGIILSNLNNFGLYNWSSLISLTITYIIYYIIFINLILFISFQSKKSSISLVICLSIWILSCLVAPKLASNYAEEKYPYPTKQEFQESISIDKKNGLDGHDPWSKEAKLLEQKVLKEYNVDSLHKLPFNFAAYRTQKGEEHEAKVYLKHYKFLKEQFNKQSNIYKNLAVISPFLPTRFLSMAISNTDYASHWDFSDTAENYRIEMQKFLNDNTSQNTKYGERGYKADAKFWKTLNQFKYDPPELGIKLNENISNILILIVWTFLSFSLYLSSKLEKL